MKKFILMLNNAITVLMFVVLVAIVFWQVICRFVLELPSPWTEELARLLVVWITYLGIAEVEAKRDGIRTLFIIQKLPIPIYKALLALSSLTAIALHVCLFVGAIEQIQTNSAYYLSSLPFLSRTVFYYPILIGSPLSIWMIIEEIIDTLKQPYPLFDEVPGGENQ